MTNWKRPWLDVQMAIQSAYGRAVGRSVESLVTPALVVDLEILERNIALMGAALAGGPARLRPHTKVQKSPNIARLQIDAGALGVTVASVWEAAAMGAADIDDILIANEVIGEEKIAAAASLAKHINLSMVVDDRRNVQMISDAFAAAGSHANILIDLDVGMGRCGVRSPEQALDLARFTNSLPHLTLKGIQAYEGHCMLEPDKQIRLQLAHEAMDYAASVKELFAHDGLDAPTLSGGGTGTYDITGKNPAVTELQAGSYVFMDAFHGNLVPGFEISLTVHTTVVARHGDTIILDAGRKSIGIDFVQPPIYGANYVARYFAEEHALFDVDAGFAATLGDHLRLICGYAPTTVNLHDVIYVAHGAEIVDVWPVFPRGPSDHGFLRLFESQ